MACVCNKIVSFEPYAGLDALVALGKYEGGTWSHGSNPDPFTESTEIHHKSGLGIAPVVGFRFYLGGFVSIGAETTFEAALYTYKTAVSELSPDPSILNSQQRYGEALFHPVSWLSVNVLF